MFQTPIRFLAQAAGELICLVPVLALIAFLAR